MTGARFSTPPDLAAPRAPAPKASAGHIGGVEVFASNGKWWWWRCNPFDLPGPAHGPFEDLVDAYLDSRRMHWE
jgi:hypothetical protein